MSGSVSDNNNSNDMMGGNMMNGQNSVPMMNPCPPYASAAGWNAVIVGLLSCILAILVLLTCLYYLAYRRRYMKNVSECPSPMALIEKTSPEKMVVSTSQTAIATFVNETGKETKANGFTDQTGTDIVANGHASSPSHANGLLANGNTDQSELRLLQHEDN